MARKPPVKRTTKVTRVPETVTTPSTADIVRIADGFHVLGDALQQQLAAISVHHERITNLQVSSEEHKQSIAAVDAKLTEVQTTLTKQLSDSTEAITKEIREGDAALSARVQSLEKWRWVIVGGWAVVVVIFGGIVWKIASIIIDKIDWAKIFMGSTTP